jgi:hypothetical protein
MRDLQDLRSKRHIFALLLLGVVPTACGRSCGCVEGEKTYETLDGKVKASLVRKVKWTGGKIPGPLTTFHLHVETTPPFDEPIRGCDHLDLAEDDAGKHIAFRCKGTQSWSVLRLRGGDRRIRECDAPVGDSNSKKPDFTKLEPVRKAADRILNCEDGDVYYTTTELTRAISEDDGKDAAALFVGDLSQRPVPESYIIDPFERGLDALDGPSRSKAMARLCSAGLGGGGSSEIYLRAALRCSLDSPEAADAGRGAGAMFTKLLRPDGDKSKTGDRALYWAAMIGAEKIPTEIGKAACDAIADATQRQDLKGSRKAIVAAVLGYTKTKCDAVSAFLDGQQPTMCTTNIDCDGGLCTENDLANDLSSWKESLALNGDGGLRTDPFTPNEERAVLRAAYVRGGGLPKSLVLANARRHYELAGLNDDELAYCSDDKIDAGAHCRCPDVPDYIRCAITSDGGAIPRVRYQYCSLRVDDAHKRFDDIKRICEVESAHCDFSSLNCCGGLKCEAIVGGVGGICKRVVVKEPKDPKDPKDGG